MVDIHRNKRHDKIAPVDSRKIVLVEWEEREKGFKGPVILRKPRGGVVLDLVHTASLCNEIFKYWRITHLFKNLKKRMDHLRKMQIS